MKTILKFKWLVLLLWLVGAAGLVVSAPSMGELVREKGQITVPEGSPSSIAAELSKKMKESSAGSESELSAVLVFHNENGLSSSDTEEMKRAIEKLKDSRAAYGITSVTSHLDMPDLEQQMKAEDGKTVLTLVNIALDGRTPAEARDALYEAIADVKVEHYYTGDWIITEDVIQSSQDGLKKTEWITLIFILTILFLVFRSAVAPFIPLLSVGISYIAAQSVVAFLAEYANFPLSNFTQIFMVAVMFGIGTDYCILLISRFKEELAERGDKAEAVLATYRTAGKTVLYSGLAVLVGFTSIGFSEFVLYRSAVAVAVGVAVLLIALVTLVPFFMAVLGKTIFWPAKGALEHKESKLWGRVGAFSLTKPVWALMLIAIIAVPLLVAYKGSTSFNSLDEIGSKYNSVKAFDIITASFGPGDSLPSSVIVETDKPLDNQAGLAVIEQVTRELEKVDGVKIVRSATRPTGEPLNDFLVSSQIGQLDDGIGQTGDGLNVISKGLSEASSALSSNAPKLNEAVQGADELVAGTNRLKDGVTQLGAGLKQIEQGMRGGSAGAKELTAGLRQARASAEQLASASKELLGHYHTMGSGLSQLSQAYTAVAGQQEQMAQGLSDLEAGMGGLGLKYPDMARDPDFQRLQGALAVLREGASQLAASMTQLNGELAGLSQGMQQANAALEQAVAGQASLAEGLAALAEGLASLEAGISQAADGQGQVVARIPELTAGLDQITSGQRELQSGFAQLSEQLGQLTSGLDQSVNGLSQVTGGLGSAQTYLSQLSGSPSNAPMSGWFVPQEALENADFQAALDMYMSSDRTMASFDVVFEQNPYATETLKMADDLQAAVARALKNTDYEQATFAVGGVTSINNDLRNISAEDYSRTVMLMLIGLTLILVLMFRSIVMPIYLILSLLLTYFTSMAVTELIFVRMLGYDGVSWAVPFFGFVMLMALGIDYSIFLMDRFKEYRHLPPQEAILKAMKNMGTVIISAAVILGGTFAAMLPSGVLSLLQIATLVLCGLFLYAFVMLPLFVPVMVRIFGPANWWPFMGGSDRTRP